MYAWPCTGRTGFPVLQLDNYTPEGDFMARTTGFNASKLAVNPGSDLFALT